jgi:hypothetical protein
MRTMFRRSIILPAIAVACLCECLAQTQRATAARVVFDVASIKPNISNSGSSSSNDSPGGYVATNMSLRRLIAIAHRMRLANDRDRIVGPSWIDSARFDINAGSSVRHPIRGAFVPSIASCLRAYLPTLKRIPTTALRGLPGNPSALSYSSSKTLSART